MAGVGGETVAARLEAGRKDLLDLGLRNPLLNYRPLRSRGIEVVDELPAEVFRLLVRERRALSFAPAAEGTTPAAPLASPLTTPDPSTEAPAATEDEWPFKTENAVAPVAAAPLADAGPFLPDDGSFGPQEASVPASRHTDRRLQTALPAEQLQTRLLSTYYAARTFVEEQGANILYLTLGLLRWYEADASAEPRRAPLLLVPVELARSTARQRFQLRYSEEEVGHNLSLAARLHADFGIALPALPPLDDLDIDAYLAAVAEAVAAQPRWAVEETAVALGLFSFGKFLMYRDLDAALWPAGEGPANHPVLGALLGDGLHEAAPSLTEEDHLDRFAAPGDLQLVVEADSSQLLAILAANEGRNLVIQGPPGTGKSQTITNLIAEAIGRGKRVLFVAEKMAALEVVKRRLDSVGLGDACLELHSHKTNKKALLGQLQQTLQLGRPRQDAQAGDLTSLGQLRDRLNAYADAVNTPVARSGVSPYSAFGELLRLRQRHPDATYPRLVPDGMSDWSSADFARRLALVEGLQARLHRLGLPAQHPFWGSHRLVFLPLERDQLRDTLHATREAAARAARAATDLAGLLAWSPPARPGEAETLCRWASWALAAPDLRSFRLASDAWRARRADIAALLAAGRELRDLHGRHDAALLPEAWEQDVAETRRDLAEYGPKWWRVFSGAYRRARRRVRELCRAVPPDRDSELALVDAILEAQRLRGILRAHDALAAGLFGTRWGGEASDWATLASAFDWLDHLHTEAGAERLPPGLVDLLTRAPYLAGLAPAVTATAAALSDYRRAVGAAVGALELDEAVRFGPGAHLADQPFAEQEALLAEWERRVDDLQGIAALNAAVQECRKEELGAVVDAALPWTEAGAQLADAFRRGWYEALLARAYRERPALAHFDGEGHEHAIDRFRQLDAVKLEHNRARLAAQHWSRLPQGDGAGQFAVLRREFEKKARHLPARQLLLRAGVAIQAIKPVFMMSPLSIASFLAPESVTFDLIVFDEASQVKPVDAFGAILRGKQAVVVGDSRQLPPTSFFDTLVAEDEADDENVTGDLESILGLFVVQGARERMLRWHYRSRHESLIAVSNHLFYNDRLVVFPSPDAERREAGLRFRHLPDTAYDRSRSRTNPQEAEAVARAVMEHARQRPDLTLGVAAFSTAQMTAIQDRVELLRRQDPSCESFFAAHPHEPFFVKNLETVQGDERDVIFISIGYGRTAEGYLSLNFGPLNGKHGGRRLNVLITRARIRCEVFTNLTADDIDLSRSDAPGVRALKTFLSYAQTGRLDVPVATGRDFDSPFEIAVAEALLAAGYAVDNQVRSAGFLIDLAIIDPERPGRYLLGIECDGATYHSARSARDRDRLRQQVLEGLGWRIHRVWSTDWFRNPDRELKHLAEAIERARASVPPRADEPTAPPAAPDREAPVEREAITADAAGPAAVLPYQLARPTPFGASIELHEVLTATLAARVVEVVIVEGPVHISEVMRRIAEAAGVRRIGVRIEAALATAIARAVRAGQLRQAGDFLWPHGLEQPELRDRSGLPAASRRLELVAPEEIALAIERAVGRSYGLTPEDIPALACRLLGFQRTTDEMRARVLPLIDELLQSGRLMRQGEQIVPGERRSFP